MSLSIKKIVIIIFAVILFIIAGLLIYFSYFKNEFKEETVPTVKNKVSEELVTTEDGKEKIKRTFSQEIEDSENQNFKTLEFSEELYVGGLEFSDRDNDGLSDEREKETGTDIDNADTDADGLKDGLEVDLYLTDPLDSDTDHDGYLDGEEISNGYNPLGSDRLEETVTEEKNIDFILSEEDL